MVYSNDVLVPGSTVPVIIGKSGVNIQKLRDMFNVKLMFLGQNSGLYEERSLRIIGAPKNVEMAKKKIESISNGTDLEFLPLEQSEDFSEEFLIPCSIFSSVIGSNGINIKTIKAILGLSYLEIEGIRVLEDGKESRVLGIHGSLDKITRAKKVLEILVNTHAVKINSSPVNNNSSVNNDSLCALINSCTVSSTTSFCSTNSLKNTNKSESYKNQDNTKGIFDSEGSDDELSMFPTNSNIHKINSFISDVNNLLCVETKRFNNELINNVLNITREFFYNFEKQNNNKALEMKYKNLENEMAEIKYELARKESIINVLNEENNQLKTENSLCIMCNKEPRNSIIMPCLHLSHCSICSKELAICPTCNKNITTRLKIKIIDN